MDDTQLFRLDKNFALNVNGFSIYEEDEDLTRNILLFCCFNYQKNLYGLSKVDVKKFVSFLGFKSSYKTLLNRRVKDPHQSKIDREYLEKKKQGDIVWDTRFENALYKLNTIPFIFNWGASIYDEEGRRQKLGGQYSYIPISRIEQYEEKVGKTTKKQYYISLNEDLAKNICKWFMCVDLNIYRSLHKSKKLYLYLCNLRDMHRQDSSITGQTRFKTLCTLTDTNCTDSWENMRYINKCLKEIQEADPNFFSTPPERVKATTTSRYKYDFLFHFNYSNNTEESRHSLIWDSVDTYINQRMLQLFLSLFPDYTVPNTTPNKQRLKFKEWTSDLNQNFHEKEAVYIAAKCFILGDKTKHSHQELIRFLRDNEVTILPD